MNIYKHAPFASVLLQPVPAEPSTVNIPTPTSKQAAQDVNVNTSLHLLSASHRTKDSILQVPDSGAEYLWYELGVDRLNVIHSWLWIAGRPMPPRALHYQRLLGREVIVTERMDMHLVWSKARIFVKPLPRFLLEPQFWVDHLSCKDQCKCSPISPHSPGRNVGCEEAQLRKCALGFLLSYAALVSHESDFFIAKDSHLLPDQISWMQWKTFIKEILEHDAIYDHINQRYIHGELRLNRLNAIYRLTGRAVFRGYQSEYSQYSSFFRDNFTWLASVLAYMVIVLAAMQVGLATKALGNDEAFQAASYGFTVFTMVASLAAVMTVFAVFLCLFTYNWIQTVRYVKVRQRDLQRRTEE
ncbi:hypothetical protein BU25DRAFT_78378 [Macroventuria anomochaeta]|uniref:Uncharacterized protein n=1 Tax=Macroventuria anomochaeta TaxID=301207 RepID=A0ACB6SF36_9PLEO|nr:uncharacterized protein BU25DRAFT_78378 [Macroventuria anomochaeta]KAF2632597.1 hypothetical protein BU25DRAFT_78378 [Macroventuria anomochaeta]